MQILRDSGFTVDVVSQLRSRAADPHDDVKNQQLLDDASAEIAVIKKRWEEFGAPACWFCYHPYYKSPDLLGPHLCQAFDVPYVTAEASYSARRSQGFWEYTQERVIESINLAAVNLYFTERDRRGIEQISSSARLAKLHPFIEPMTATADRPSRNEPINLVTVAMMRDGDKYSSYSSLAEALALIVDAHWTLHIVGDGPKRSDVQVLFNQFPEGRIVWHGELSREAIETLYAQCAVYVWPGWGEAYGLAYLEAQSAGLPVVAFDTAGVPEVVANGYGGRLIEAGSIEAYATAVHDLMSHSGEREKMSINARQHVLDKHTRQQASKDLHRILQSAIDFDV